MKRRWISAPGPTRILRRAFVGGVLAVSIASQSASHAASPPQTAPLREGLRLRETVEGVEHYSLDNGMSLLLVHEPSQSQFSVEIVYRVGSRYEGSGEAGMAHLLEHMLFKGSRRHRDQRAEFQEHGADFNAETSVDYTAYYETMLASADNLRFALDLEADRMTTARLEASDLSREFSVVRNELENGENSPHEVLQQRLLHIAYSWHGYGRDTIGNRSDVENVPIERLRQFYQKHYQPDNATLIIAGGFDKALAVREVARLFGRLPRPARVLIPTYTVEPVQDGERRVTVRRTGDISVVGLGYHSVAAADPEFAAEEAALDVLVHEGTGRLDQALVQTHLATHLTAEALHTAQPGMALLMADVPKGHPAQPVSERMVAVTEELAKQGPSDEELRRFQRSYRKEFRRISADPHALAADLAQWVVAGDFRLRYLHRDRVAALRPQDVQRFATRYLVADNRSLGLFLPTENPQRSPQPQPLNVAAAVRGYQGQAAPSPGEVFAANFDTIESRTQRLQLANGMQVALLPKRSRAQQVSLVVSLQGGSLQALRGRAGWMDLLGPMLFRGTQRKTFAQINDAFDDLDTELQPPEPGVLAASDPQITLSLQTTRAQLPAVLKLLAELLQESSFPSDQLERVRKEQITQVQSSLQQPVALAANEVLRRLQDYATDDPRHVATLPARIQQLSAPTAPDLQRFYREHFGGPNAQIALVGDLDPQETRQLLETELGRFRAAQPYQRLSRPAQAHVGSESTIQVADKHGAVVLSAQSFAVSDRDPDAPALELFNFLLGGHENARLNTRLREQSGVAYTVASGLQLSAHEPSGIFLLYFTCAPQNARSGLEQLRHELIQLMEKGPTAAELAAAQRTYQKHVEADLANDLALAARMATRMKQGRSLRFDQEQLRRMLQLTPADVAAAARRHIDPARLITVLAGSLPVH